MEIETLVLLAYAIEDSTDIFRISGGVWTPQTPPLGTPLLLFVTPWCTLLAERPCLHWYRSKKNDAIKVKLRSRDHSSTNHKHACAEGSVTNLKMCYGESADNFW